MRVFVSAAEPSGDALGGDLVRALTGRVESIDAFGLAGAQMRAAGVDALADASSVGVNGLVEVVRHLPRLMALTRALAKEAIRRCPDVAVLIDAPDFNIRVARRLHAAGIPVVFYGAPTVWAWRSGRARAYASAIRRMLVLFPFELEAWRHAGVPADCVGHPLVDALPRPSPVSRVDPGTFAMLPGSRASEIRRHLPTLLQAARSLADEPGLRRILLPLAAGLDPATIEREVASAGLSSRVQLIVGGTSADRHALLGEALGAWVASGTATLEMALLGRPHLIFYRFHPVTYAVGRRLVHVPHFGLPNLIAGKEVSPELLQADLRPEAMVAFARRVIRDEPFRARMTAGLSAVREALPGPGAADRAAKAVLEVARAARPSSTKRVAWSTSGAR